MDLGGRLRAARCTTASTVADLDRPTLPAADPPSSSADVQGDALLVCDDRRGRKITFKPPFCRGVQANTVRKLVSLVRDSVQGRISAGVWPSQLLRGGV